MKFYLTNCLAAFFALSVHAQNVDSSATERFSVHAQTTVVNQFKPEFKAKYSGDNSLITQEESQISITSTLYLGARLWRGASVFLNPEIAGGSGLSEALGVADAPNGETFRVGSPAPSLYLARLFFRQTFALSGEKSGQTSDFNQLAGSEPTHYLSLTAGKISMADYFDDNKYSHDPRTQFMSWALMSNGAWDYPANVRGYTPSIVAEWVTPKNELRYGFSLLPLVANGGDMNWKIGQAGGHTLEFVHRRRWGNRDGAVRLLTFYNYGTMGDYKEAVALRPDAPDVTQTRRDGGSKYGICLNVEQDLTDDLGAFLRASWNDGKHETWVFTEIDNSLSAGISLNGRRWGRPNDQIGLAYVSSGISNPHRDYLAAGGKGFMLGDGTLNYAREQLVEAQYRAELVPNHLYLTGAYQFLLNPGYNADRNGPIHVFSVRVHARI